MVWTVATLRQEDLPNLSLVQGPRSVMVSFESNEGCMCMCMCTCVCVCVFSVHVWQNSDI